MSEFPTLSKNEILPGETPEIQSGDTYPGSELNRMLNLQRENTGQAMALFTDIDDSFFLPGDPEESKALFDEAGEQNYPVIADTGNQIQVVRDRIASGELPEFQAVCSSVGSQIWVLKSDETGERSYVPDSKYREKVLATGFDRKEVAALAENEIEVYSQSDPDLKLSFQWPIEEREFLEGGHYLENQEFKVSLQFESDLEKMYDVKNKFHEIFPRAKVSVCEIKKIDEQKNLYFMDILAADKADAINYLCEELGIDVGMVAGDSGNDIAMLSNTYANVHSVLVGSHKPEAYNAISKLTSGPEVSGKGSFRRVPTGESNKLFYIERKGLRGPHSIKRAAEILLRASRIAKLSKEKKR